MKLDKRHLAAALTLLVGSIIYNIWVYTRPAGTLTAATPMADAGGVADPGVAAVPAGDVDPMQLAAPPDVVLDRLPQWPRDPFANVHLQLVAEPIVAEEPPLPDADPVVASILYASERKLAMLNGAIVRVGDQVGPDRVVDILPGGVVVESASRGRRMLALKAPSTPVGVRQ